MTAYYNEHDPFCAAWLRNLIAAGLIAPGDVDERDIRDIQPVDIIGYTQCHFFAGIGLWSAALRTAGWPDDRPVWTGSCPCQPFSSAGKRKAGADERHLWPVWFGLIRECRPDTIFGEQVEGAIRFGWLDRVCADLEGEGYAVGQAVLGAHSIGAPHIRQRLFWVADAMRGGSEPGPARRDRPESATVGAARGELSRPGAESRVSGQSLGLADSQRGTAERHRHDVDAAPGNPESRAKERKWLRTDAGDGEFAGGVADAQGRTPGAGDNISARQPNAGGGGSTDGMAYDPRDGCGQGSENARGCGGGARAAQERRGPSERGAPLRLGNAEHGRRERRDSERQGAGTALPSGESNRWHAAAWLPCADGKSRPVPQSVFQRMADDGAAGLGLDDMPPEAGHPLAKSEKGRVGALRAFGNAIVPQLAAEFIGAFLDIEIML